MVKENYKVMISTLEKLPYNPNEMTAKSFKKLIASVKEYSSDIAGWNKKDGYRLATSITVNIKGNRIVGGEHRTDALRELGQDWIHASDIVWVDIEPDSAREKALNVALNRADAQGDFNQDKLDLILSEVKVNAPEIFLSTEMDVLSDNDVSAKEKNAGKDNAPELPEKPVSSKGEVYRLGKHLLFCGDCTTDESLIKLDYLAGKARMVFTDPPYNMNYQSKNLGGIKNDALGEATFVRLILGSVKNMLSSLQDGGSYYVCMGTSEYSTVSAQLKKFGLEHRLIVWAKPGIGLGAQDYRPMVELILYGIKGAKQNRTFNGGRRERDLWEFDLDSNVFAREEKGATVVEIGEGLKTTKLILNGKVNGKVVSFEGQESDIWREGRERGSYVHPTQKPVALVERALRNSTTENDLVFDPFLGSGTTLITCESLNRICYGCELDPRYADVIRRRWVEYVTGTDSEWESQTKL